MMDTTLIKTLIVSIALIVATLLIYPYFKDSSRGPIAEWHMINVNIGGQQGDANLLVVGDQVVMIDAGKNEIGYSAVIPYLEKFGIKQIDHFFISNPGDAYYGGMVAILDSGIPIARIYHHRDAELAINSEQYRRWYIESLQFASDKGSEVIAVGRGFTVDLPSDSRIEVVHAQEGAQIKNGKPMIDGSLIVKFEISESSVLFSADAGRRLGKSLSDIPGIRAEFLKMPHPGEDNPAPAKFYDAVNPDFVLVPGPKRRWCGDAGRVAREWTIKKQVPTWVTGSNGHIRVIWRPGEVLIAPQYDDGRCKLKTFGSVQVKRES